MTDEQPRVPAAGEPLASEPPATGRRQALKDELWGMGVADDLAETWIARWEAAAAELGVTPQDADWWSRAATWIDEHRPAD
jgi:hypothetical protein